MLKLLIVEDNDFERNALLRNIKWDILGIQVADTAFNGRDGLEKALRLRPDIVVSDVMMPAMNGIEMAKKILEAHPETRFVFTSGYGDIALLKDAMEVRAYNYIIKPVKPEELTRTVKKMASEVIDEKLFKSGTTVIQQRFEENIEFLREKFLADLFRRERPQECAEEIYNRAVALNIDLTGFYCLALAELDYSPALLPRVQEQTAELIGSLRGSDPSGRCLFASAGEGVAAFIPFAEGSAAERDRAIDSIHTRLRQGAEAGQYRFSLGVSEDSGSIADCPALFRQCTLAAGRKIEQGYGHVLRYENLDEAGGEGAHAAQLSDAAELYAAITAKVYRGEAVDGELQSLAGLPWPADARLKRAKSAFIGLVSFLARKLAANGDSLAAISEDETDVYYAILSAATIPDITAYLKKLLASLATHLGRKRLDKDAYIAGEVTAILQAEYAQPITLTYLSDKVFLSPNYLRILFKNRMGVSIQDYLTDIRMNKAKELLSNGKYKVYEVGTLVGYPNSTYFSIAFKNHADMTPGEYRLKFLSDSAQP